MRSDECPKGAVPLLVTALDCVATDIISDGPVSALADDVVELHKQLARLQGQIARRVAALDMQSAGQIDGHVSTASWLRQSCSTTHEYAYGLLRTARTLRDRPECAKALVNGVISYPHTQVISATLAQLPPDTHDGAEPLLLEAAAQLDPGQLRTVALRLRETINRDDHQRSINRDHNRRRLHISPALDGMFVLDGLLDPEAGAVLLSALQPLAAPLGPDDKRSPAQRRADALAEIANQVLAVGHLPTVASRRPSLNVTISLPSLRKDPKTAGGELDWAGPITAEAARRIGCDASVTRILLGPRSQPLDVGRAHRLVTPAQRKALALRDRGCTRASWWCDAHHRISWIDGGETDLGNLQLLCRTHHRWHHESVHSAAAQPQLVARPGSPQQPRQPESEP